MGSLISEVDVAGAEAGWIACKECEPFLIVHLSLSLYIYIYMYIHIYIYIYAHEYTDINTHI